MISLKMKKKEEKTADQIIYPFVTFKIVQKTRSKMSNK